MMCRILLKLERAGLSFIQECSEFVPARVCVFLKTCNKQDVSSLSTVHLN